MTPWPDEVLERQMIHDADLCFAQSAYDGVFAEAADHIRKLLKRVRELEQREAAPTPEAVARMKWLLRCEEAVTSMAGQFIHPKTAAQEMVDHILKGTHDQAP